MARRTIIRRAGRLALLVALAGCGTARRGVPVQSPFVPASAQVAEGERAFMRFCNGCHPGGEAGLGPAINNKPLPAWLIRFQIRHGLGAMPSFPDRVIPAEERDAIATYLVALRRHEGVE